MLSTAMDCPKLNVPLFADTLTRRMRSSVTATGGSRLTELALAMRESSLVGKRMEGVVEGVHTGDTKYRRREEALFNFTYGRCLYVIV